MRDMLNSFHAVMAVAPAAARTDNTAIVSAIIDRKGFDAATFLIQLGALTDVNATFVVLLEDGDASNLSDAAAVADEQLVGTELLAGFTFAEDNKVRKLGYVGDKRYLRLTITPSANDSGNIFLSVTAILGFPALRPTSNPPA